MDAAGAPAPSLVSGLIATQGTGLAWSVKPNKIWFSAAEKGFGIQMVVISWRGRCQEAPVFYHHPDRATRETGVFVERVGFYNPKATEPKPNSGLHGRLEHWRSVGPK